MTSFAAIKLGITTVTWAYDVHLQLLDLSRCAGPMRLPRAVGELLYILELDLSLT
jgi:hypothetical protein